MILVLFPQNMIIQQIIHSGVRSKLKELNDSSKKEEKKNKSKKRHPPPRGSNAHVYMYACKTKCLIDINNFTRHENLHVVIMDYHKNNIAKLKVLKESFRILVYKNNIHNLLGGLHLHV